VQVSPELVEIGSDGAAASRWQQPFDAELADVFRVQGEIAGKVAEAMRVAIGGTDQIRLAALPTKNPAAYDAFLRGEAIAAPLNNAATDLRRAISHFERAVQLDPTFADAWAQLADTRSLLYTNGRPTPELAREARDAADRALALSPSGARPRRALGNYFRNVEFDNRRAVEEMEKARAAAPNDADIITAYAVALTSAGRFEDAVRELRAAQQLDPRSPTPVNRLRTALIWLRRYDEAREATDRLLALAPTNPQALEARAMVEIGTGNLAVARQISKAVPGMDQDAFVAYFATYWDLGWVLDDADQQRALSLGVEPFDGDRANWAIVRAQIYGWRGDSLRARIWGDTAAKEFAAQLRDTPNDGQRHAFRGLALAYTGRKAEAIAEGERGVALLPPEKDAVGGPYQVHQLTRIYLLTGEREKALDLLEQLLARPYYLSPGWLRIDPTFASLKGNPRFERLSSAR
jgi:serine/threonine-protein kinase